MERTELAKALVSIKADSSIKREVRQIASKLLKVLEKEQRPASCPTLTPTTPSGVEKRHDLDLTQQSVDTKVQRTPLTASESCARRVGHSLAGPSSSYGGAEDIIYLL